MQTKILGNTDLNVSQLCLGTMTMGWTSNKEESFAVMDYALANGINFFDTADIYSFWAEGNEGGVAEQWIGEWLQSRQARDKVIIATKARGRMWDGPDGEGLSRTHLMRAVEDSLRRRTLPSRGPSWVVAQTDGSFVPIVEFKEGKGDKRTRRKKEYKEVRLCVAYAHKSASAHYASGGFCNVEKTGKALARAALKAGWNAQGSVHCMGDGAAWIAKQAQLQFGSECFLLDFFHVCEYLHPAAQACNPQHPEEWIQQQAQLLKKSESSVAQEKRKLESY